MQITVIFITSSIACRIMLLIWFSSFDWISWIFVCLFTSSYHPFLIEMFSKNGLVQDLSLAYNCNCWKHTIKKMCFGKSKIIYQYLYLQAIFSGSLVLLKKLFRGCCIYVMNLNNGLYIPSQHFSSSLLPIHSKPIQPSRTVSKVHRKL